MASRKFHRKIEEVAAEVTDDGERFIAGAAGQAGTGMVAKLGGASQPLYQKARLAATVTGDMFAALAILTDRNVYLIRTPPLKAYEVKEVVLKRPVGDAEVVLTGKNRLQIDDYCLTYTLRMGSEAKRFAELASRTAD